MKVLLIVDINIIRMMPMVIIFLAILSGSHPGNFRPWRLFKMQSAISLGSS